MFLLVVDDREQLLVIKKVSLMPVVEDRDGASPALCLTPAQWMTPKLNFDTQRRQYASRLVEPAQSNIQLSVSGSDWIVNRWPLKYGREKKQD